LYSLLQASSRSRASASDRNQEALRHSALRRLLNALMWALSAWLAGAGEVDLHLVQLGPWSSCGPRIPARCPPSASAAAPRSRASRSSSATRRRLGNSLSALSRAPLACGRRSLSECGSADHRRARPRRSPSTAPRSAPSHEAVPPGSARPACAAAPSSASTAPPRCRAGRFVCGSWANPPAAATRAGAGSHSAPAPQPGRAAAGAARPADSDASGIDAMTSGSPSPSSYARRRSWTAVSCGGRNTGVSRSPRRASAPNRPRALLPT
jgi:hypothetical protein